MNKKLMYRSGMALVALAFGAFYSLYQPTKYGLDIKGGVSILLEASPLEGRLDSSSMEKLAEVIDRRINSLGVAEPVIQIVGKNNLSVEIPGVSDTEEAVSMIGRTALLEFRIKDSDGTLGESLLNGKDLVKAEVRDSGGMPNVYIKFSKEGARTFYNITKNNVGKQLAITLDGEVQSSPNINSAIADGNAYISGNFTYQEAKKLALLLSAGSLPVRVDVAEVRVVSATLGESAFDSSMQAGMWALILIMAFMTFWYFLPGFIASISLAVFGFLSLGVMNFLGATLTLPGIAGFILSLGMAVDANVIIFEMIKDEINNGASILASIKNGFNKSLTSIIDSNITTLIITAILFALGTGSVKGYAVTLSIGVIASMFSAIFVTKLLMDLLFDSLGIKSKLSFGVINFKFNFNIIKFSYFIFAISLGAIGFSAYSLASKGLNYGVDFTGGTLLELKFEEEINKDSFISTVSQEDEKAQVQFSEGNIAIIKASEMTSEAVGDFYSTLRRSFGQFDVNREESIGASVGNSLQRNAIIALIVGSLLIVLYISLRFKLAFALAAIIALLHDIFISIGAISYLGYEVNSTFIIAILTILGYSINDTVVVFDRIRENMGGKDLKEIINKSVNQVFIRSFNTSLTTFLSLLALVLYGAESLKPFLITFLFGIIAGTFSSLFLASPLVYFMRKRS